MALPLAGAVTVSVLSGSAQADGGRVYCPPDGSPCRIIAEDTVTTPGQKGGDRGGSRQSGHSGGKPTCRDDSTGGAGQEVPCHLDGFGSWDSKTSCYYQLANPQPPAGDPAWEGRSPGDGAIYDAYCPNHDAGFLTQWFATPPGGAAQPVDPEVLALEAVKKMTLLGPDIASPKASGKFAVGMPVWMHINRSPNTFGPVTASASAGAVTVTATAKVSTIRWSMGDGTTVTCTKPGTPYKPAYGKRESPDCGHLYTTTSASRPGDKFTVTATSTWGIDWQGGGQSGQLTETRESQVEIAVGEVQVLG
ncbi:ATP/GTP-binding protein [Streptomyces xinghaiensis]|uniref:ATP/GTP-binding protein n=1 Tax=Streptomyces xinghaiensis TaxID=1038928 RepID=UPI0002D8D432|nr:ATP/GTP-binding protein [Streptomyces xinghaiensis]